MDCIEFDNQYRRVMEYLLGRVVIVENLQHAVRMSKQQGTGGLRFVTLEGDVINASGAITGGLTAIKQQVCWSERRAKALRDKLPRLQEEQKQLSEELEAGRHFRK